MDVTSRQRKRAPVSAGTHAMGKPTLRTLAAWGALQRHYESVKRVNLRQLFADDPRRGERLAAEAAGLYLDYSKNRVTDETLGLLVQLAQESGLRGRIEAMFRGDAINITENRAVLHVALRAPHGASIMHDGRNVVPEVHAVLTGWRISPTGCVAEPGKATLASASATSSTSASADRIWDR
jgi:hypothetical protein